MLSTSSFSPKLPCGGLMMIFRPLQQALKSYEKDLAAIQDAEKRRADLPHGARRSGAGSPSCPRPTEKKGSDSQGNLATMTAFCEFGAKRAIKLLDVPYPGSIIVGTI